MVSVNDIRSEFLKFFVDKGHTGHISKAQYERWVNSNK